MSTSQIVFTVLFFAVIIVLAIALRISQAGKEYDKACRRDCHQGRNCTCIED
jgi:hypothetical protein